MLFRDSNNRMNHHVCWGIWDILWAPCFREDGTDTYKFKGIIRWRKDQWDKELKKRAMCWEMTQLTDPVCGAGCLKWATTVLHPLRVQKYLICQHQYQFQWCCCLKPHYTNYNYEYLWHDNKTMTNILRNILLLSSNIILYQNQQLHLCDFMSHITDGKHCNINVHMKFVVLTLSSRKTCLEMYLFAQNWAFHFQWMDLWCVTAASWQPKWLQSFCNCRYINICIFNICAIQTGCEKIEI